MNNYDVIVEAEKQFAREVTFGVLYQKRSSAWYYLIPGMFLIDFLIRGSAIRRYTETFMFPRNLALRAARDLLDGQERSSIDDRHKAKIYNWLESHRLLSAELSRAQKAAVDVLTEHYKQLLQAEGEVYFDLIESAYPSRSDFQTHIEQIAAAEKEVDRAILATVGDNPKLVEKLQLEEQQVAERRNRILDNIY
jgi:hypothetical protein